MLHKTWTSGSVSERPWYSIGFWMHNIMYKMLSRQHDIFPTGWYVACAKSKCGNEANMYLPRRRRFVSFYLSKIVCLCWQSIVTVRMFSSKSTQLPFNLCFSYTISRRLMGVPQITHPIWILFHASKVVHFRNMCNVHYATTMFMKLIWVRCETDTKN